MKWHLACFNHRARNIADLTDAAMISRSDHGISTKHISFRCLHDSVTSFSCFWERLFCQVLSEGCLADLHLAWLRGLGLPPAIRARSRNSPKKTTGKMREPPPGPCASMGMHTEHMPQSSALLRFRRVPLASVLIWNFNLPMEHFNQKPFS